MFDEITNVAMQRLNSADPGDVSEAVRREVGAMPPLEIAAHIKTTIANIENSGNTALAKELADAALAAQSEPEALKRAFIAFVQAHPEAVTQFAPQLSERIYARL